MFFLLECQKLFFSKSNHAYVIDRLMFWSIVVIIELNEMFTFEKVTFYPDKILRLFQWSYYIKLMSFINRWSMSFILIRKYEFIALKVFVQNWNFSLTVKKARRKKKKRTPVSHPSLSSRMCCCLCASNEEFLYFHLVVSISITAAASISSVRTRKRTHKIFIYIFICVILIEQNEFECCCVLFFTS